MRRRRARVFGIIMIESTPLAVLPLIAGLLVMAFRFYAREGAISVFSLSFVLATLAAVLLVTYMILTVIGSLPSYAWVGFGGFGTLMTVGGIWSFYR
jgi:hypothetical protein